MGEPAVVYVRHSGGTWYVTSRGRAGLFWHSTEDDAIQEALLWACLIQPVRVVEIDGGRETTIAEYGSLK